MAEQLSVADVLERAADLIEPEGAWTQDYFAKDAHGHFVEIDDRVNKATCFCLYGAIGVAAGEHPEAYQAADPFLISVLKVSSPAGVAEWNDAAFRTQAEVVAKLREAAALAREQSK